MRIVTTLELPDPVLQILRPLGEVLGPEDWERSLPEADAVLGFDDYPDIAARLRSVLAGEKLHPHTPTDRRKLLPISPSDAPTK